MTGLKEKKATPTTLILELEAPLNADAAVYVVVSADEVPAEETELVALLAAALTSDSLGAPSTVLLENYRASVATSIHISRHAASASILRSR